MVPWEDSVPLSKSPVISSEAWWFCYFSELRETVFDNFCCKINRKAKIIENGSRSSEKSQNHHALLKITNEFDRGTEGTIKK